jgi:hypothetical protein
MAIWLDSIGQRVAHAIEGVGDGIVQTFHGGDCTETDQGRNRGVFESSPDRNLHSQTG